MKVPNLQKWKLASQLEGLLFFAQCLDELLFHHTIDTYKAPALNTHSNAFELEFLASEYLRGLVRTNTLDSVIEELEWNFHNDPVVKATSIQVLRALLAKLKSLRDKPTQMDPVASALAAEVGRTYWPTLRTMIPIAIGDPKNKDEILALAISFVVELELRGFSREYIYYVTQRFFFDPAAEPKEINAGAQIDQFLDMFDVKSSKWTIIFRATETFSPLKDLAKEYGIEISHKQSAGPKTTLWSKRFLGRSSQYPLYLTARAVEAREPHTAKRQGEMAIELLADLASFHNHVAQLNWFESCLVAPESGSSSVLLKPPPGAMRCGAQTRRAEKASGVSAGYEALTGGHLSPSSVEAVARALEYHRAALDSKTAENQLLDLWAALEVVLPAERMEGPRIDRYVGHVLPFLTLIQAEKIFRDLAQNLNFAGPAAKGIVDSVGNEEDFFAKTTALIVASDLTDRRKELYSKLDANPLLRQRCFRCHEMFKSSNHCLSALQNHRNRVRWHIYRIYNSRNQIIHSARSLPYVDTLVENLHAYVDGLILAIWEVTKRSPTTLNVSSALEIMAASEKSHFDHLAKQDVECTSANFLSIVFGNDNPLGPHVRQ
jgi:hypothetical protein